VVAAADSKNAASVAAAAAAVATKKVATIAAVAAVDTTEIINTLLPTTYINPSGFRKDFLFTP